MNYLLFATKNGLVKKTVIEAYRSIRKSGLVAIKLDKNDQLLSTKNTTEKDEVILVTAQGKSIRFQESDIRPTGRATRGVKGIKVRKGDEVVTMETINPKNKNLKLLVVSENGYGKMTKISEYSTQGRGGQGVFTAKVTKKIGKLIGAALINLKNEPDLLVISASGQVIRLPLTSVSILSRQTQGVKLINLEKGDRVAALTYLEKDTA